MLINQIKKRASEAEILVHSASRFKLNDFLMKNVNLASVRAAYPICHCSSRAAADVVEALPSLCPPGV